MRNSVSTLIYLRQRLKGLQVECKNGKVKQKDDPLYIFLWIAILTVGSLLYFAI